MPEIRLPFKKALEKYQQLRKRFETGSLSKADFTTELKKLTFSHEGRYWTIGAQSGTWFVHDGRTWVAADPPVDTRTAKSPQSPRAAPAPAMRASPSKGPVSKTAWNSPVLDYNIKGIEFLPDSATLVATCFDPNARVLHIGSNSSGSLKVSEDKYLLDAIDSSGDGRFIFCAGIGRQTPGVWVWKTDAIGFGQQVAPWSKVYDAPALVTSIASSYDGSRLAVGMSDGSVSLVEGTGGHELNRLTPRQGAIGRVAISADGRHVAASGKIDAWVKLWESGSSRELHEWRDGSANSLEFSRDGSRLLAAMRGSVITWNVPSGSAGARLTASSMNYDRAVFSSDGHRIIAAGRSAKESTSTVVLCETVTAGQVRTIGKIDSAVECMAVSRDSSFVACGGSDRRVHVLSM